MIGLVACCKTKLDRPAPALELYQSPLFRGSALYATLHCDDVYILSAKHGLVCLEQTLEPYNQSLSELDVARRGVWGLAVAQMLLEHHSERPLRLMLLAGELYTRPLRAGLAQLAPAPHVRIVEPLRGLQIGERLSWLKRERAARSFA